MFVMVGGKEIVDADEDVEELYVDEVVLWREAVGGCNCDWEWVVLVVVEGVCDADDAVDADGTDTDADAFVVLFVMAVIVAGLSP